MEIDINRLDMSSSTLKDLIDNIENDISNDSPRIECVDSPLELLSALKDLYGIIGMRKIKNSIAEQTSFLMEKQREGIIDKGMLNTILYGPPGVGKTTVGIILARIWNALGYIKCEKKENIVTTVTHELSDTQNLEYLIVVMYGLFLLIGGIISFLKLIFDNIKIKYLIIGLLISICVIVIGIYIAYAATKPSKVIQYHTITGKDENGEEKEIKKEVKTDPYEDIIKIARKSDFIASYLGMTSPKTEKLLKDNLGKVLFIDEAYSLCEDTKDIYGMDAITAINQYMSEHPGDCTVIFAGYKNKLQNGIFKFQPGLSGRCMWHFECDTYDGNELTDIFKKSLEKKGYKLRDLELVRELIIENSECFTSYGRDVDRLVNYSQINQSLRRDRNLGEITYSDVEKGIGSLKENNINTNKIEKPNVNSTMNDDELLQMAKMLKLLQTMQNTKIQQPVISENRRIDNEY